MERPTHRLRDEELRNEGAQRMQRNMDIENQAVNMAEQAYGAGKRDGTGEGRRQGQAEMAGLMQQDGQNYGTPQVDETQAMAEEVAMGVLQGQINPAQLQQEIESGGPNAQVASMALQLADAEMQRQAMQGQPVAQPQAPQPQGPAGLA